MRRPELVIPYCEDQIGSYFIQVRPDGTRHTLWISQCNTKALVKANIKDEQRRAHAYRQWLAKRAAGKLPKTKAVVKSKPLPPPPVPFEDVMMMEETGYESSDEETEQPTSTTFDDLSSSDEEEPEVTQPKTPITPKSKAQRTRAKEQAVYTLPKSQSERAKSRTP